jgi:hypothetical protein
MPDYAERDMDMYSLNQRAGTPRTVIVVGKQQQVTVHGVHARFRSLTLVDFAGGASRRGLIQD